MCNVANHIIYHLVFSCVKNSIHLTVIVALSIVMSQNCITGGTKKMGCVHGSRDVGRVQGRFHAVSIGGS